MSALASPVQVSANVLAPTKGTVNCADLDNIVSGTLKADLLITEHGSKCVITGTVKGNVKVIDDSMVCAQPPEGMGQVSEELTAANVIGGTVKGNITSSGGHCAMIWLRHGAKVNGKVVHRAAGNLGFLDVTGDTHPGSKVRGDVVLRSGKLFASSVAQDNRVDGSIVCNGGVPAFGPGSKTDWDGDGDVDGTIGRRYLCSSKPNVKVTTALVNWHAQSGNSGAVRGATGLLITKPSGALVPSDINTAM